MGCRQPYRLTREVRFELVVDLIGDAVPRLGADYRLITEFLGQYFERHPGNLRGVLTERVHDERLRERAVPRERHEVREAFEVGHGHRKSGGYEETSGACLGGGVLRLECRVICQQPCQIDGG